MEKIKFNKKQIIFLKDLLCSIYNHGYYSGTVRYAELVKDDALSALENGNLSICCCSIIKTMDKEIKELGRRERRYKEDVDELINRTIDTNE